MSPKVILVLGLITIGAFTAIPQGRSQQSTRPATTVAKPPFPTPPPGSGSPSGRRQGGASRGTCDQVEELTALVPLVEDNVWGLTVSDHPTLWFNIPESLASGTTGEFILQDQENNYIHKTTIALSEEKAGIINIPVPTTASPLEVGENYKWTFSVYCDPDNPSSLVFVKGGLQRVSVDPAIASQLDTMPVLDQSTLLASNGIWHDALTRLGQGRLADPEASTLAQAWTDLLQRVDLEEIASEPLSSCCTPVD